METLKRYLSEHPFFEGLPEEHIDLLVGCAANARFEAGEHIFRQGADANVFYVLRHGQVAVDIFSSSKGSITIETLGPGEILGWSWLVPPYQWHFDARAIVLTRALVMDAKCLRQKFENDNHVGYEMFKRFAKVMMNRLHATHLQLLDVYSD